MVGYSLETAQGLVQLSNPNNAVLCLSKFGAEHAGSRQGVPANPHEANVGQRTTQVEQ